MEVSGEEAEQGARESPVWAAGAYCATNHVFPSIGCLSNDGLPCRAFVDGVVRVLLVSPFQRLYDLAVSGILVH